jgi:hypothetical protein
MQRWLRDYGFALLVSVALACASYLAGSAAIPEPVPDYALQAEEVYRLEIGAAFFIAFYLALMAFLLALGGRGFAEFGTQGLKAQTVVALRTKQQEALSRQREIDHQALAKLEKLKRNLEQQENALNNLSRSR